MSIRKNVIIVMSQGAMFCLAPRHVPIEEEQTRNLQCQIENALLSGSLESKRWLTSRQLESQFDNLIEFELALRG